MKKSVLKKFLLVAVALLAAIFFNGAYANDHHHAHSCNHHAANSAYNIAFTVKCAECSKISPLKTCSDCNGTGNKNYKDAGKPYEEDPKCYGSGQVHTDCGHAYINPVLNPPIKCAECGVTSSLKTCSNCNGTGNKNYKDPNKPWEDDNNCKGSGKLHIQCSHGYVDQVVDEIPELVFRNPVLISGEDRKEGAKYLFANVAPGIDANILLRKFSRSDIYMQSIDLTGMGWDKAFQPQFGLPGTVAANQDWYIDFQLTFLKSGSTVKETVDKFTVTSLDVDGDNYSLKEYVIMEKASSVTYAKNSYVDKTPPATIVVPTCPKCGKQSMPEACKKCGGDGLEGKKKCKTCQGVGKVYHECGHPWDGQDATAYGPVNHRVDIDTAATDVMATYVYNNKDVINFRIGANSGQYGTHSNVGIRLNSMWFKGFNMNPLGYNALPVKLHNLKAAKEATAVLLSWSAETETSLSHFVVERSADGKNFKELATVFPGAGVNNSYSYKDLTPATGNTAVSYRIRMVDATQQSSYSTVVAVRMAKETENGTAITAYPNPVQGQLKIAVPAAWQGKKVAFKIYNGGGAVKYTSEIQKANSTTTVSLGHLPAGVYIVEAACNGAAAQQVLYKN